MSVVVNVLLSLISVPPHALCNLSVRMVVKLCILGVFSLGVSLPRVFFDPVYEDLQYDEISLIFTAWMCLARSGVGGEGVSEMDFGFSNRVGIRGVLDVYLCLGCGGVGGEWVGAGNRFWRVGWWYVCASYESELFM